MKDVYHVDKNDVEHILCLHLVNVTWPCVVIMINGHVTVYHYNDTRLTVTRWSFDSDQRHVWRRFDQSAKQLIVGHTTMQYNIIMTAVIMTNQMRLCAKLVIACVGTKDPRAHSVISYYADTSETSDKIFSKENNREAPLRLLTAAETFTVDRLPKRTRSRCSVRPIYLNKPPIKSQMWA